MYNVKDTQFVGKHDFDKESAEKFAQWGGDSFSINIFQWELKSDGKSMKRGKCVVRLKSTLSKLHMALLTAENIVDDLDKGIWDGRKTVSLKD